MLRATDEGGTSASAPERFFRQSLPFRAVGRRPGSVGRRPLRRGSAEPLAARASGAAIYRRPAARRRRAADLLDMLATEPDLASRVSAAIRVGDRRWNLRIDNAIDVLLPGDAAANAWTQLARLERSSAILKRDVQTVDVRLPDRLVLRVNEEVPKEAPTAKKGRPPAKNT